MAFNSSKCVVMHITSARHLSNSQYTVHNRILDKVDAARYLGVDISGNLNFNQHIRGLFRRGGVGVGNGVPNIPYPIINDPKYPVSQNYFFKYPKIILDKYPVSQIKWKISQNKIQIRFIIVVEKQNKKKKKKKINK